MKMIKYLKLAFLVCMLIFSCKKDQSTEATIDVPDLYIDTVGQVNRFEIRQHVDELLISPVVKYKENESNLSYLWRIYPPGGDPNRATVVDTLSRVRDLKMSIVKSPGTYTAELQIKDNKTQIIASMRYSVVVTGAYSYGWLLAYETAGGGSTDVALLRTSAIIKNLSGDVVMKNIYAAANGAPLSGQPVAIATGNNNVLWTRTSASRFEPSSFKALQSFNQLFVGSPPLPKVEAIAKLGAGGNMLINDKKVYWQNSGIYVGDVYLDEKGYEAAPFGFDYAGQQGAFYDSKNKRFFYKVYYQNTAISFEGPKGGDIPRFSLDNIGKEMLFIGVGFGQNSGSVSDPYKYAFFEDTDKSRRWFYGISFVNPNKPDLCMIDISNLPEIFNATMFELGNLGNVAYYSTESRVYVFNYDNNSNAVTSNRIAFTAPTGETVTCIRLFKDQGSGYSAGETRSNRVMFISTWNQAAKNGKVYQVIVNPTSGDLTLPATSVFEGFGKVKDMMLKPS